jgi:hypothetical protein
MSGIGVDLIFVMLAILFVLVLRLGFLVGRVGITFAPRMSSIGMDQTLSIVRNAPSGLGSILRLLDLMLSISLALTLIMLHFLGNSCDTTVTVAEAVVRFSRRGLSSLTCWLRSDDFCCIQKNRSKSARAMLRTEQPAFSKHSLQVMGIPSKKA